MLRRAKIIISDRQAFESTMQWYVTQKACVRWGSAVSDNFFVSHGVRQGGILSPLLFNVYMDCLSDSLCNTYTGCNIGGIMINHLMYADDLVIISPSTGDRPL